MRCEEIRAVFLAGDESQAHLDHLASCRDCRSQWEAMDGARRILDDPAFWDAPPDDMEERVVALIGGAPPQAPSARRSRAVASVAGAAAVAAIVVAAVVWMGLRSPAPDWKVTIPGTDEAPAAAGVVQGWVERGGTRLTLDVEGLPAAPDGFVYEFWFSKGSQHISAGTFADADHVELWVGVMRADFPRLWITLEPLDDDESLSGVNVMDTG